MAMLLTTVAGCLGPIDEDSDSAEDLRRRHRVCNSCSAPDASTSSPDMSDSTPTPSDPPMPSPEPSPQPSTPPAVPSCNAPASCVFVRPSATGNGSGVDWANAAAWSTLSPVRGKTYMIASGTYAGKALRTPMSGTTPILFRKATQVDHGTDSGWTSDLGVGQATFAPLMIEDTGYLVLDGAYEYGFKINVGVGGVGINFTGWTYFDRPGVRIQYVEIAGPGGKDGYPYPVGGDTRCLNAGVWINSQPVTITDMTVSHCNFHGATTLVQTANTVRMTIEHTRLADSRMDYQGAYDPNKPHDNVAFIANGRDTTFRFNDVTNWDVTGFYPCYHSYGFMKIYGNVFHDSAQSGWPTAVWLFGSGSQYESIYIYNNTFYNLPWNGVGGDATLSIGTGEVKNNLFFNVAGENSFYTMAHDYNWYSGASKRNEPNGIAAGTLNPFDGIPSLSAAVSATAPRDKGVALDASYAIDARGTTRGADGHWDIGAREYLP